MRIPPERRRRAALVAGVAVGAVGLASAAGSLGAAWYFARVLLTPEKHRPDNTVLRDLDADEVRLDLDAETIIPGRYGLWLEGGRTHVRVGELVRVDPRDRVVVRRLLGVDVGVPAPGPGRWTGHYYAARPDRSLGLPTLDVDVPGEIGALPSWLVPGDPTPAIPAAPHPVPHPRGGRWAVLVHGRGAMREECLRAVPVLHAEGIHALIPSYRNDGTAPPSPDGLYNLGLSEWRDVEAAIRYCLDAGAEDVTVLGWSMGGAIVLQTLARSVLAVRVDRVVLDAPVIDWVDVIEHHARLRHVPRLLAALSQRLIGARWAHRAVGVHEPIDVAHTRWQARAEELAHRVLLIHSVDDDFVPVGPSIELAARRPDLVRLELWSRAHHAKEWNVDPERWERLVGDFLATTAAGAPPPTPWPGHLLGAAG